MEPIEHITPPLDSFPYRHRVSDLMASPLITLGGEIPLQEACGWMVDHAVSSVVVLDGGQRPIAIITERDVLRAVAQYGAKALEQPLLTYASSPVHTIRAEAFVYVALGRMNRLKLRHLVCVDGRRRAVGIITAGALLAQRAGDTLRLGDQIVEATDAQGLASVRGALPGLAQALLADAVPVMTIAAVISGVMRDITRRACQISEQAMCQDPAWGAPPVPYAALVLGAVGRGESLLNGQQENALVYDGDASAAPWFEEFSRRVCTFLCDAGIAVSDRGTMMNRPDWCRSLQGWEEKLSQWLAAPTPDAIHNADIFFDYVLVHGDIPLVGRLRRVALGNARRAMTFLNVLGESMAQGNDGLGLFGGFKTGEDGSFDLRVHGLLPVVQGARVLALHHGVASTSSAGRLLQVYHMDGLGLDHVESATQAQEEISKIMLQQQIKDSEAGNPIGTLVYPDALSPAEVSRLKEALHAGDHLGLLVRDRLIEIVPVPVPGV
jgi:signal-transduction protein with cAMP-binding, CBS, and nucleotidyltransferase domain